MWTTLKYTLLSARRDFLFLGIFITILLVFGLASFVGSTALSEQNQATLAFFAGSSRFVLVAGLAVFICFYIRKLFDSFEMAALLSKPIKRIELVAGFLGAFASLAFFLSVPILIIMLFLVNNIPNVGFDSAILWSFSLFLESTIIAAFSLLVSLILRSSVMAVIASIGFYIMARLMGFFLMAIDTPESLIAGTQTTRVMAEILKYISVIIPRLDLFAKGEWLIYGEYNLNQIFLFSGQSLVFIALLMAVATFDLRRKEF